MTKSFVRGLEGLNKWQRRKFVRRYWIYFPLDFMTNYVTCMSRKVIVNKNDVIKIIYLKFKSSFMFKMGKELLLLVIFA